MQPPPRSNVMGSAMQPWLLARVAGGVATAPTASISASGASPSNAAAAPLAASPSLPQLTVRFCAPEASVADSPTAAASAYPHSPHLQSHSQPLPQRLGGAKPAASAPSVGQAGGGQAGMGASPARRQLQYEGVRGGTPTPQQAVQYAWGGSPVPLDHCASGELGLPRPLQPAAGGSLHSGTVHASLGGGAHALLAASASPQGSPLRMRQQQQQHHHQQAPPTASASEARFARARRLSAVLDGASGPAAAAVAGSSASLLRNSWAAYDNGGGAAATPTAAGSSSFLRSSWAASGYPDGSGGGGGAARAGADVGGMRSGAEAVQGGRGVVRRRASALSPQLHDAMARDGPWKELIRTELAAQQCGEGVSAR